MLEESQRALSSTEQRSIRLKISASERVWRSSLRRGALVWPIIFGTLWALTMCASTSSRLVVSAFWAAVGVGHYSRVSQAAYRAEMRPGWSPGIPHEQAETSQF
jgi:hypothetical protein